MPTSDIFPIPVGWTSSNVGAERFFLGSPQLGDSIYWIYYKETGVYYPPSHLPEYRLVVSMGYSQLAWLHGHQSRRFSSQSFQNLHVITVCIVCRMFIPSVPNDSSYPCSATPGRSSPCLVVTAQATQFLMFPIKIARTIATDWAINPACSRQNQKYHRIVDDLLHLSSYGPTPLVGCFPYENMAPFPGIQQALPGATETIGASEEKKCWLWSIGNGGFRWFNPPEMGIIIYISMWLVGSTHLEKY
jgi:hypothetical protein